VAEPSSWRRSRRRRAGTARRLHRRRHRRRPQRHPGVGIPGGVGGEVGDEVGDEAGDGFDVAGIAGGDRGGGDDFAVGVDGEVALVAVEAAVVGLVPVPGLRVDGGDDPVRGDLPGDAEHAVGAGFQVLTQHRGEQLRRLHHRLRQVPITVKGGEQGVAVTGPGVDQRLPAALSSQSMTGLAELA
jgi:hypothetical protein